MISKTVLITGASSGFGRATAELLGKKNYRLILIARRKDRLEDLQKTLPGPTFITGLDVTNDREVAQFFKTLPEEFRSIDILINNAGLALGVDAAPDVSLQDWDQMVATNIQGLLHMTHPVLAQMRTRGSGLIINIGSVAATLPYKGSNVYGATKAFVRQFSRNLRTDLFGTNIKVTNIEPGLAETELFAIRFKGDTTKVKKTYGAARLLKAEDIANTIEWIVSQPPHINIDNIEIMPLDHTFGGAAVNRRDGS
jgi:NADP-dependent 3-hydroxy acid dehydrogenase YdfG